VKLVEIINMNIFLHALPLFYVNITISNEYKLSALHVRMSEKNKLSAMTQQFITAKISGCARGSKTHSSLRQSNLQLQNKASLMSCRTRAVEHRKSADGLAGALPGLQDRILLNYARIEIAHKVRKQTFVFFCYVKKSNKPLVFLFPC